MLLCFKFAAPTNLLKVQLLSFSLLPYVFPFNLPLSIQSFRELKILSGDVCANPSPAKVVLWKWNAILIPAIHGVVRRRASIMFFYGVLKLLKSGVWSTSVPCIMMDRALVIPWGLLLINFGRTGRILAPATPPFIVNCSCLLLCLVQIFPEFGILIQNCLLSTFVLLLHMTRC